MYLVYLIPEVLDKINIKNQVVTIDAMGTQTAIAEKIRSKRADYVLALKGNQTSLHEDVRLYFEDAQVLQEIRDNGKKDDKTRKWRITGISLFHQQSFPDITLASRAVRGHWAVERMHWHVDVTFMEDANTTLDKLSAQNLNIIR